MRALALVLAILSTGSQPSSPDVLVVRGRDHPELIPEHLLWSEVFPLLATIRRQKWEQERGPQLGPRDAEIAYRAAADYKPREDACTEKEQRAHEALTGDPKRQREATNAIQLECRWQVLEARDRMLAAMSPDGAAVMAAWAEKEKQHITFTVLKAEWELFRQPK